MKWKRSRKAKEQASSSGQSDTELLRTGKTADKSSLGNRAVNQDDGGEELDLEEGEEEEEEEEEELGSQRGFPVAVGNGVGLPRSDSDFLQRTAMAELGYNPHSPFTDDELENVGGDRKIGAGL